MQNAFAVIIELHAAEGADLFHLFFAVEAEAQNVHAVFLCAARRAIAKKTQTPFDHRHISARAEDERCVFLEHPFGNLGEYGRIGPGLGMAETQLTAIGETRL